MDQTLPNSSPLFPRFMRLTVANVLSIIIVPLANLMSVIFLGHFSEVYNLTKSRTKIPRVICLINRWVNG